MLIISTVLLVLTTTINAFGIEPDSRLSTERIYIFKCCPEGKHVGKRKTCVSYNKTLSFSTIKVYDEEMKDTGKSLEDVFNLKPSKFEDVFFKKEVLDFTIIGIAFNIYVTESGVLQLEVLNAYKSWNPIPIGNYCVDYRIMSDPSKITPRFWVKPPPEFVQRVISIPIVTLVSSFFLFLVLLVYLLLPELQNLCGLILMAYVFSLFMAFLLQVIIRIKLHSSPICIGLTMSIYYFFLATFCWMSVMSYDIWCTFRGYAKARATHRQGELFKFLMYALFAFGFPLIMTIGLAVLNSIQDQMRQLPWFVIPHVPEFGCFLDDGVLLLYLYIPMLILIICNWMFYLMTAFSIWRLSRGTAVLDSATAGNPQAHRSHRHRFMVYLKLSIVMGLYPGLKIWLLSDIYNILLGLAIFLIFVCKKKILRKLCERYLGRKTMRWQGRTQDLSKGGQVSV